MFCRARRRFYPFDINSYSLLSPAALPVWYFINELIRKTPTAAAPEEEKNNIFDNFLVLCCCSCLCQRKDSPVRIETTAFRMGVLGIRTRNGTGSEF